MYQVILKEIKRKKLFEHHRKVLIAVSGGIDSINLLHCLYQNREQLSLEIGIAHINHKQRPESDAEEQYLIDWAKRHQIPIYTSHFLGSTFNENVARDFRYEFFKKIMILEDYSAVVTGHHADDQAETVLMKLVRGGRLRHLSGIKQVQTFGPGELIRPFLTIPKNGLADIYHFQDESNMSSDYFRNRVRNSYLPQFEKENPRFSAYLNQLSKEISVTFQAIDDLTENIDITDCDVFLKQTKAVQTLLLQKYLEQFGNLQLSRQQFDIILTLLRTKPNLEYPIKANYYLYKNYERFSIRQVSHPQVTSNTLILSKEETQIYDNYSFFMSSDILKIDSNYIIPLYADNPLILRRRQEGDKINFGTFSKKLRRLFIDEKIAIDKRNKAIVGEQNREIQFVLVGDSLYLRKAPEHGIIRAKIYINSLEKR